MLVELEEDAQQDDDVMRKYTWGLDLVRPNRRAGLARRRPAASLTRLRRVKHRSAVCWPWKNRKRSAAR